MKLRNILILSFIFFNIGCDQISKSVVRKTIESHERIEVFNDNFIVTKVENTGAAYSWGADLGPVLKVILLQLVPLFVLFILLRQLLTRTSYSKGTIIGLALIIGGGIGNLFDRIAYGSVTDFLILDLGFIKTEIFNLADVSIMLGAILVVTLALFTKEGTILRAKTQ